MNLSRALLLLLLTLTAIPTLAQAESSVTKQGGPTIGISPVGLALGDLNGMTGSIHLGWRLNSKVALLVDAGGVFSATGHGYIADASQVPSSEDFYTLGAKWWALPSTWISSTVGLAQLTDVGDVLASGTGVELKAGQRLGHYVSIVLFGKAAYYDAETQTKTVGLGLELEWGAPI